MEEEGTLKFTALQKQWILCVVSFCALLAVFGLMGENDKLVLKEEEFYVEYGNDFDSSSEAILEVENSDILEGVEITTTLEYLSDNDYPEIGTYSGVATYDDQEVTFTIIVQE